MSDVKPKQSPENSQPAAVPAATVQAAPVAKKFVQSKPISQVRAEIQAKHTQESARVKVIYKQNKSQLNDSF